MFTGAIYTLTVSLPILVAAFFGIVYIKIGYQLQMFCVEMVVIEVSMFIIMSIELLKIRKHMVKKKEYKISPQDIMKDRFLVMAGVPTDEPGSAPGSYSPKEDQKTLLKLIQRINVKDAGKRNVEEYTTIKEIQDLHE